LRLTLNRPDKRNALDAALCRALVSAIQAAASDPGRRHPAARQRQSLLRRNGLAEIQQVTDTGEIDAVQEQLSLSERA